MWILHVVALRIVDLLMDSDIMDANLERTGVSIFLAWINELQGVSDVEEEEVREHES